MILPGQLTNFGCTFIRDKIVFSTVSRPAESRLAPNPVSVQTLRAGKAIGTSIGHWYPRRPRSAIITGAQQTHSPHNFHVYTDINLPSVLL
jgi:hypothetical protein